MEPPFIQQQPVACAEQRISKTGLKAPCRLVVAFSTSSAASFLVADKKKDSKEDNVRIKTKKKETEVGYSAGKAVQ